MTEREAGQPREDDPGDLGARPLVPEPTVPEPTAPGLIAPVSPEAGDFAGRAARGFAVNAGFGLALRVLGVAEGLVVPRVLGPSMVGLFAVAGSVLSVGNSLKEFGISQKLVQDDAPLEETYPTAFTLELISSTVLALGVIALAPLFAAIRHEPQIVPLVAALAVTLFANAFVGLPGAVFLRRLAYVRQSTVAAVAPVVSFVVTVGLAVAGAGVWALAGGAIASFVVSSVVVTAMAPLKPRLELNRAVARRFIAFGWPLWLSGLLGLSTTIAGTLVIAAQLGNSGLAFFVLSQNLGAQAYQFDAILGRSIYPVLCRTTDDKAAQRRAFETTTRITTIWAGVAGFGLVLFAGDLVRHILGPKWAPATFLIEMQGFAVVTGSLGYSWDLFFRARGNTKPTLLLSAMNELWVFAVLLPAVILKGLTGGAWAVASLSVLTLVVRQVPISRLFPGLSLIRTARRELASVGAAAALTALIRSAAGHPTSLLAAAMFVGLFLSLVAAFIAAVDGRFLRDLLRVFRRRG
ncbi:MAG TPA: oligosaccharide flippase family protein [Acidimicrobiales bacterium]|nr:oligosaccharide flippase family protein [Acidimicrobiales bacterium]